MEWEMKVLRFHRKYICQNQSIRLHLKDKFRLQLFLFDPRLELLLFGLRQWLIGFQFIVSLCPLMLWIIYFLALILDPHCEAKLPQLGREDFLLLGTFLGILLNLLNVLRLLRIKKTFNGCKLGTIFPEEWQADLKTLQKRWMKQNYSCQKIRFLTIKHIFHMVLGYIQIQLENIWLPNNVSLKKLNNFKTYKVLRS